MEATLLLKGKTKLTFKIHELTNPLLTNVIISKYLHIVDTKLSQTQTKYIYLQLFKWWGKLRSNPINMKVIGVFSLWFLASGFVQQPRPQITRALDLQKPFVPRKQLITALRLSNSNSNSNSNIAYFVNSHILHTFIIKWVDFIIVNTKIIFLHNI